MTLIRVTSAWSPPLWMKICNRPLPLIGRSIALPPTTWRWQVGRWLRRSLPLERFDVVFASPLPVGEALVKSRARQGVKLAGSLDCTDILYRRDLLGEPQTSPDRAQQEAAGCQAFDLLSPWSAWAADSLRNDYGVPSERIQICRPSLDPKVIMAATASSRSANREEMVIPTNLVNLLFVGADFERKGGPQLLRWHQQHFADRSRLHIVSGKVTPDASAKNVVWHGAVPNEKLLSEILPAMDVFVFPTQRDMFGIVIVEAAAFGLPVVASRLAAIPELVKDGETGFLCAPSDEAAFIRAIGQLIDDRPLRLRMSTAAKIRAASEFIPAAQFGPMFDRLIELCEQNRS